VKLRTLKHEQAKLFNKILVTCSLKPIMDNLEGLNDPEQAQFYIDNFLKLCYAILEEKNFLCYYEDKFQLSEQIEIVYQISDNRMYG
jgi:hypothetical protein